MHSEDFHPGLSLRLTSSTFSAGDELKGVLSWSFAEKNREIALACGWYVSGSRYVDFRCHAQKVFRTADAVGEAPVSFQLPAGPLTLRGTLFEVQWIIEAVDVKTMRDSYLPFALR